MSTRFLLFPLFVLCALAGCMGAGGSIALDVSERPAGPRRQPAPTPAKTPVWIDIATGAIEMERVFTQQLAGGTDEQQDKGRVDLAVQQRKDWLDSGQVSGGEVVKGVGWLAWTEAVSTPNCSWKASATGTMTITGMLYGYPLCKLSLKITEQWNPPTITWQQCSFPLGAIPPHPNVSYDADFPLQDNARLRGAEVTSGAWNEKWWILRDLKLDARTRCSDRPTPGP